MTIREVLETVDRLKPNQYGSADKLRWLSELDGAVYREILTQHETQTAAFAGYTPEADLDGPVVSGDEDRRRQRGDDEVQQFRRQVQYVLSGVPERVQPGASAEERSGVYQAVGGIAGCFIQS